MFRTGFRLPFTLFGIPIRLDVTFFLLLVLLTWVIGAQVGAYVRIFNLPIDPQPLQEGATPWLLGLLSALGLIVSVLIHELAHALVARRYGVEIKEITLWILGGIAQLREMPRQRGAEAIVAIAGPITSLLLGGLFWLATQVISPAMAAVLFVISYLAVINVLLAVFNMLPALPMDGGRVLRSLLALRLNYLRATRIAVMSSHVIAVLLGIYAFLSLNIFLMAIAVFIYLAGRAETQYAVMTHALEDIRVDDIMTHDIDTVHPDMRVPDFIKLMLAKKHLCYPVVDDYGQLLGVAKLYHAENADENSVISDIMSRDIAMIRREASAVDAFKRISESDSHRLIVTDEDGNLLGIISNSDLVKAIQIRMVGRDMTESKAPTTEPVR